MRGGLYNEETLPSNQKEVTIPALPVSLGDHFDMTVDNDIAFHMISAR